MPCPRCGKDGCLDPSHQLKPETAQHISETPQPSSSVSQQSNNNDSNNNDSNNNSNNNEVIVANQTVSGEFLDGTPNGDYEAIWNPDRRRLHFPFIVQVQFFPYGEGNGDLRQGQYRQYVRGVFRINGEIQVHSLPLGNSLSSSEYQIDGPKHSRCYYGQREWSGEMRDSNIYCADLSARKTKYSFNVNGAFFQASDDPAIEGEPGQVIEIDLEFIGVITDMGTEKTLAKRKWRVRGRMYVPFDIPKIEDKKSEKDKDRDGDSKGGKSKGRCVIS